MHSARGPQSGHFQNHAPVLSLRPRGAKGRDGRRAGAAAAAAAAAARGCATVVAMAAVVPVTAVRRAVACTRSARQNGMTGGWLRWWGVEMFLVALAALARVVKPWGFALLVLWDSRTFTHCRRRPGIALHFGTYRSNSLRSIDWHENFGPNFGR